MAIIETPSLTLEDAIARSADIYDVWVSYWGTRIDTNNAPSYLGADSYPYFTQPGLRNSIAGIAIGPESMVDRVWISTNPSKDVAQLQRTADLVRLVSVEQPLLFTQAAKQASPLSSLIPGFDPNAAATPYQAQANGLFYAMANVARQGVTTITSTEIPPTYLKADGTEADLNMPINDGINLKFSPPMLQLRLLLRPGIVVPTKRSPAFYGNYDNGVVGLTAGVETTIRQIPIYGRKNVVVHMRALHATEPTNTFTFRVATLRTLNYDAIVQEETVGEKTVVTSQAGEVATARFHICNPAASYLMLYATSSTGAPGSLRGWTVGLED